MSEQDQPQTPAAHEHPQRDSARGGGERGEHGGRRGGRGRRRPHQSPQHGQQREQGRQDDSLLNLGELRELADLFTSHGLTDFEFENADIRIRLSRNPAPGQTVGYQNPLAQPAAHAAPPQPTPAAHEGAQSAAAASEPAPVAEPAAELHIITSPIVGTFYRASSPTAEPFVRVGGHVDPDSVVCIIEAMKLMNEIQAEVSGTVEKIYVENGQPVEYGQPLFGVKK